MTLHPQARAYFELREQAAAPPLASVTAPQARELSARAIALIGPGPALAAVREVAIPVGDTTIPGRVYEPPQPTGLGLVWLHGGGWVVGSVAGADAMCRRLALRSGATVLSVDYRLAPEHRFPTAVHDALAALGFAEGELEHPAGLVVGGDSAGGNLAAVCARHARDSGGPALALQLLVYPVLDHDLDTPSYREFGGLGHPLGRAEMEWFWDQYVDPDQRMSPDASPSRAADLSGLAPALIVAARYDPLRDEIDRYAARLAASGVPTEVLAYEDMFHGFWQMVNYLSRADEAVDAVAQRLARLGGRVSARLPPT